MPDASPPDWSAEVRVQYDPEDPARTLSLEMAEWILQKQYKHNRGAFANKAADAFRATVFKDGSDEKGGG